MSWTKHSPTRYTLGSAELVKVGRVWTLDLAGVSHVLGRRASFDHAEAVISEHS